MKGSKPIGWEGKTLKEMLEESERVFAETGRYHGIEELKLKEEDPTRFERIFTSIRGNMVNARETCRNIASSPGTKEIGELCFILYTPEGDNVAMSTGIMAHVHTMGPAIKWMIRNDYEENPGIRPGDIFCNNDVLIGNMHFTDIQTIVPIFHKDELVAWATGVSHQMDIGGVVPGSVGYHGCDRPGDGVWIPCQKIGEDDTLFRHHIFRGQWGTRTPNYWILDERARIAGCHVIREAITRLIEREGLDVYKRFVREVIEEERLSFLTRVKETLIPGRYYGARFWDARWKNEMQVPPRARVDTLFHAPLQIEIGADGRFDMSLEGASKWGHHSYNASPFAMEGGIWILLTQSCLVANDKVNDGQFFATSLSVPPGSWANPATYWASGGLAWHCCWCGLSSLFNLLSRGHYSRGFLEETISGCGRTVTVLEGGGIDQYSRETGFSDVAMCAPGWGAGAVRDGLGYGSAMWNPEADMGEVEINELMVPLVNLGRSVKPNTGGAGRFRGGNGFEQVYLVWYTNEFVLYNHGDNFVVADTGLFGGYPSACGYNHAMRNTNFKQLIQQKLPYPVREITPEQSELTRFLKGDELLDEDSPQMPVDVKEGDVWLMWLRGGPGCGDPLERDVRRVEDDLNECEVLPEYVGDLYGIEAHKVDGKWRVDPVKTEERRAAVKAGRAKRGIPVSEWMKREREKILNKDFIEPVVEMYRSSMNLGKGWAKFYREFWDLPADFEF